MTALYNPAVALAAVIRGIIEEQSSGELMDFDLSQKTADAIAGNLLDRDATFKTRALPLGFGIVVTILPVPEPIVIDGLTLIEQHAYDLIVKSFAGKMVNLHGWTFYARRYGRMEFCKVRRYDTYLQAGPKRMFVASDIISIVEVPAP